MRLNLIQQGTERKSIKIQGTRMYASKKLVGQISNLHFEYSSSWSFEPQGSDVSPVHTNDPAHTNNPALTNDPIHTNNTINPSPNVNDSHSNWLSLPVQICALNIRSVLNKLSNFQSFVYSNPFEIYCITETWLSDFVYDHEIIPSKFNIYRKDRKSHWGKIHFNCHYSNQ